MFQVLFRCGHQQTIGEKTNDPRCSTCGNGIVARVLNAPAPRFRGTVSGPHAETVPLEAIAINLAQPDAPPLKLEPVPEVS